MLERDPDLLEYLENCRARPFEGAVFRVVWADRSPLQGSSGARGRWSSPDSQFEVLNTSFVAEGASAEFEAFWSLFEQRPDRKAVNSKLRVRLQRVVELDFEVLEQLSVGKATYRSRDYSRTQEISDGLNYLGYSGLIAVNGGGIMPHAERPGGPVAAAQKCATYGPLSVVSRGGGCTAWSSMRRFVWRLSMRV